MYSLNNHIYAPNKGRASNAGIPSIPRHFSNRKSIMVKSKTKDIKVLQVVRALQAMREPERGSRHFRPARGRSKVTR